MPFVVDATGAPRILRLTMTGDWPTLEEQSSWRQSAIASGQITVETRSLIDVRGLINLPNYLELQKVLAAIARDGGWPLYRAFLTATTTQYGVARQLQLMAPQTISVEVFTDANEAEAWLNT